MLQLRAALMDGKPLTRAGGSRSFEQRLECLSRSLSRLRIGKKATEMVRNQDDTADLVDPLLGVDVRAKVTLGNRQPHRARKHGQPFALQSDQPIAHGPGLVGVFGESGNEEAPSLEAALFRPCKPILEQGAEPRLAGRGTKSRTDGDRDELASGEIDRRKLERNFGMEVGEETALRKAKIAGQLADGEATEPGLRCHIGGVPEDGLTRHLPFS
jgi:hypothetical protein